MHKSDLARYWKTVVDTIQDAVMIVDASGTIVFVNRAFEQITLYAADAVEGRSCALLDCERCEFARRSQPQQWCRLFQDGNMRLHRCAVRREDGRYVPVLKNASVLRDHQGKVIAAVETMTDISELLARDIQIEAFRQQLRAEEEYHGIIGSSAAMQAVFDMIHDAAHSDAAVIIYGESGTGKELVAKAIHAAPGETARPFVKVNCAALNESLLESELFGHVKGAFTGAVKDRQGRFEAADGGDIFLDEIGDLPASAQVKLLRVLEEKVVERVGDHRPIPINVRVITATNRNLKQLLEQGHFRQDLFFRINVIPIHVPPLRARTDDIPLLAEHFFQRLQLKSRKKITGISPAAMSCLMAYAWPGNVRELKSAFEYAFVTCRRAAISPADLPPEIRNSARPEHTKTTLEASGADLEKQQLLQALKNAEYNQTRAAAILGVSRVTVWNRMKKYSITLKGVQPPPNTGR